MSSIITPQRIGDVQPSLAQIIHLLVNTFEWNYELLDRVGEILTEAGYIALCPGIPSVPHCGNARYAEVDLCPECERDQLEEHHD